MKTGGQILIGAIKPLKRTAVAYDGAQTVALLRYPVDEPLASLLVRLDTAVANAQKTGRLVDEVNRHGADRTYEY